MKNKEIMPINAVKLSEISDTLIVRQNPEPYTIFINQEIHKNGYLQVCFGEPINKPAANFQHPNLVCSNKVIHSFRTYSRWYEKAGVDHWFVIPTDKIYIVPDEGYSYIKAFINGIKVNFNVSGGTNGKGWADWLSAKTHVGVGYSLRDLKRIAEVSIRGTAAENSLIKPLEDKTHFELLKTRKTVPQKIVILYKKGNSNIQLKLNENTTIAAGQICKLVDINFCQKRLCRPPTKKEQENSSYQITSIVNYVETNRIRNFIVEAEGRKIRTSLKHINWIETEKLNQENFEKLLKTT